MSTENISYFEKYLEYSKIKPVYTEFPCKKDKKPIGIWSEYPQNQRVLDKKQNRGVRLGEGEKTFLHCIDFDIYDDQEKLEAIKNIFFKTTGTNLNTITHQKTPSNGFHVFFTSEIQSHTKYLKINEKDQLELRGYHSYVLTAPSVALNKKGILRPYWINQSIEKTSFIFFDKILEFFHKVKEEFGELRSSSNKIKSGAKRKFNPFNSQFEKCYSIDDYIENQTYLINKDLIEILNKFNIHFKEGSEYIKIRNPFSPFGKSDFNSNIYKSNCLVFDFSDRKIYTLKQVLSKKDKYLTSFLDENNQNNFNKVFKDQVETIEIEKYISEKSDLIIDKINNNQNVKIIAPTGTGKTHFIFDILPNFFEDKILMLQSLTATNDQKSEKYELDLIDGKISNLEAKHILQNSNKITSTYEALKRFKKLELEYEKVISIMDESHNLITSATYRNDSLNNIVANKDKFKKFIEMTGTAYALYDNENILVFTRQFNPFKNTRACLIQYNNKLEDLIIELKKDSKNKKVILLNDKSEIDIVKTLLENETDFVIDTLDREKKETDIYKYIVRENKIPDSTDILLSTQVISEGIDLNNENVDVYLFANDIPHIYIQFLSRFRKGVKNIYLFFKLKDVQELFNFESEVKNKIDFVQKFVNYLNRNRKDFEELIEKKIDGKNFIDLQLKSLKTKSILRSFIFEQDSKFFVNEFAIRFNIFMSFYSKVASNPYFLVELLKVKNINKFSIIKTDNVETEQVKDLKQENKEIKEKLKEELKEKITNNKYIENKNKTFQEKTLLLETYSRKRLNKTTKKTIFEEETNYYFENNSKLFNLKLLENYYKFYKKIKIKDSEIDKQVLEFCDQSTTNVNIFFKTLYFLKDKEFFEKDSREEQIKRDLNYYDFMLLYKIHLIIKDKEQIEENVLISLIKSKIKVPITTRKLNTLLKILCDFKIKREQLGKDKIEKRTIILQLVYKNFTNLLGLSNINKDYLFSLFYKA